MAPLFVLTSRHVPHVHSAVGDRDEQLLCIYQQHTSDTYDVIAHLRQCTRADYTTIGGTADAKFTMIGG